MAKLSQIVCRTCIEMDLNPDRYTDDTPNNEMTSFRVVVLLL